MKKSYFEVKTHHRNLALAVIEQSGGWEDFQQTAENVNRGGADAGHNGWISHHETIQFTCFCWNRIMQALCDWSDETGERVADLVAAFPVLRGVMGAQEIEAHLLTGPKPLVTVADADEGVVMLYNALAWFALEVIVHEYTRIMEDEDEDDPQEALADQEELERVAQEREGRQDLPG